MVAIAHTMETLSCPVLGTSTHDVAIDAAVNKRAAAEKEGGWRLLRPWRIITVPPSGQALSSTLRI